MSATLLALLSAWDQLASLDQDAVLGQHETHALVVDQDLA